MPQETAIERRANDASVETHDVTTALHPRSIDSTDKALAAHGETDANNAELTAQAVDNTAPSSPSTVSGSNDLKRKREADAHALDAEEPTTEENECVRQFSLAQVRVRVKRARLEANIAVQEDIKTLRFALLQAEQEAQERAREKDEAEKRYAALQKSTDEIVKMHQRTLHGMRDNLKLETLVASLDKEKASKEALREAYQKQNAELLRAQQRVASLDAQIVKYQKTETVLAQSISHFQEQFSSKDQERSAVIDRVKRELEAQHFETRVALETDVKRTTLERDALQVKLQALQAEHVGLQETAQAVVEMQEKREAEQAELRARVAQFDTEKAVLVSKVDQVQKADTQLRSKIKTLEEQLLQLQQDNDLLKSENMELGKIASELMEMAEQQHAEKEQITQTPDKDGNERLARTRTRLRESLG